MGHVLDHIGLNVPDLDAAKRYYDLMMPHLGYESFFASDEQFSYQPANGKPGTRVFFYQAPLPNEYVRKNVGLQHLAFRARTRDQVDDAYGSALEIGSEILYGPRQFPHYHENYYASFWFDPHGFLIEIVCHKPPTE